MSRGRKERTPAQLAVLAQAREKAKIVIAERAKLNAHAKTGAETEPLTEDVLPPPEPAKMKLLPNPCWKRFLLLLPNLNLNLKTLLPRPPPEPVSVSENEDEEPRSPSPKYHYINGMYIKIK